MEAPLRVILVDDESMAIDYLAHLIEWESAGFAVAATATNGDSAIEAFERVRPRVVFADISMPGISGLDLCERFLAQEPGLKVVLLTAYREFEYARRALGLGIGRYIIKHELDATRLLSELAALRSEIEAEDATNRLLARYTVLDKIQEFEAGGMSPELRERSLGKDSKTFVFVVVGIDKPYPILGADPEGVHLVEPPVAELASLLPEACSWVDCVRMDGRSWILCLASRVPLSPASSAPLDFATAAAGLFERRLEGSCSALAVVGPRDLDKVANLRGRAAAFFERSPFLGPRAVSVDGGAEPPVPEDEADRTFESTIEPALAAFRSGLDRDEEDVWGRALEEAFAIVRSSLSPRCLRRCCDEVAAAIERWAEERAVPHLDPARAPACYSIEEARDAFATMIRERSADQDPRMGLYSSRTKAALRFLSANYGRDISVADVARALDIGESSLSKTFKIETGVGLLERLTEMRIAEAKRLLRGTSMRIYEVAERVGYRSSQYFSQVFLKATGAHPLEYRERSRGSGA
jgi:Response regulator containing CheY-like receiver domain and AraC-type DNA-binding domain